MLLILLVSLSRLLDSNAKELQNRSCWKLRSGKSGEGVLLEHLPCQLLLRQEMKMCWMMMARRNGRLVDFSFCLCRGVLLAFTGVNCFLV